MLKTLHAYLLKDLIKVMLLTLVALTLLMSVLAIIQPLRKFGLAGQLLLELFLYTIPIMVSLTLPVAALFAGTLVYGRFSQDNEFLAAKAGGISTTSLLRPALMLGVVVTLVSLVLINEVAPRLWTLSDLVQNNVRQIVFHKLESRGYFDFKRERDRHVIHADSVDADANAMYGIVYILHRRPRTVEEKAKEAAEANRRDPNGAARAQSDPNDKGSTRMFWAEWAALSFTQDANGDDEILVRAKKPTILAGGEIEGMPLGEDFVFPPIPVDSRIKERTSWYGWTTLLKFLRNPEGHSVVRRELSRIRQGLSAGMLSADVVEAIQAGQPYDRLALGDEQFIIDAAWAEAGRSTAVLTATTPDGSLSKLVSVLIKRDKRVVASVTARKGTVSLAWSRVTRRPQVTIRLEGDVKVDFIGDPGGRRTNRPNFWTRGEIPIPDGILSRADDISLADIYRDPRSITKDEKVIASIEHLRDRKIPMLRRNLIAELHTRAAYGASCFLMVAMGAALGLRFRGGQFISAFAISVVPALAVIVFLLMGKELVRNPANSDVVGLSCIWGGIVLLTAANVVIYARLARK